jgi:hypothetical protein
MSKFVLAAFSLGLCGFLVAGENTVTTTTTTTTAGAEPVQGPVARRLGRLALRKLFSRQGAPESAVSEVVESRPAEIRTTSTYRTSKVGERVSIVPAGSSKSASSAAGNCPNCK